MNQLKFSQTLKGSAAQHYIQYLQGKLHNKELKKTKPIIGL